MKLLHSISCAVLLVIAVQMKLSTAAYCSGSPDPGERTNDFPIYDSKELRFVRSAKNAMLFEAGPENASFPVLHVWGSPYEMGVAQGTILKEEVRRFAASVWGYLSVSLLEEWTGPILPTWAKELIILKGMERALDWTAEVTAPFTPQRYYDEVRGIADAAGIDYNTLYRINMFPELTKASCSFFGAWGKAVGKENHSYQLRALDFDTTGPFRDFPLVTVYHPNEGEGKPFAQVGWPGSIGSLTGFSMEQLAISEIGVYFADDSFGQGTDDTPPEKVHGEPWMFVLRDVLQYETSRTSAIERIQNSNRTCNLVIGVGDGKENMVNGIEYSGYVAVPYDDVTLLPENDTWHPKIEDIVYNGMDWDCPSYNEVMSQQLTKYYGTITEDNVVKNILPTVQTGDLHSAVYDLTSSTMHVSFCRKSTADESEPHYAYERQFTRLYMQDLFAQQKQE